MRNLTDADRQGVVQFLLESSHNGEIPYGQFARTAEKFHCSRWTITRIWDRHKRSKAQHGTYGDASSRIKGNSGRKGFNKEEILEKIKALPHPKRQKIRMIAAKMRVSVGVIQRLLKAKKIRRHSNKIKPLLTPKNKLERVKFASSFVDESSQLSKSLI